MMELLNVVAIIAAGLMVGALSICQQQAPWPACLGASCPFWYFLVFLPTLAETLRQWRQSGSLPTWFATSTILWALASLYSVTALVPINNRLASWEKVAAPADWKTFRSRWDLLHRWRVVLLTAALAFLDRRSGSPLDTPMQKGAADFLLRIAWARRGDTSRLVAVQV